MHAKEKQTHGSPGSSGSYYESPTGSGSDDDGDWSETECSAAIEKSKQELEEKKKEEAKRAQQQKKPSRKPPPPPLLPSPPPSQKKK